MPQFPEQIPIPADDPTNPVIGPVSERYAIVGEDARAMPLDRFSVARPASRTLMLANVLTISPSSQTDPYSLLVTTSVWVEVGDRVTVVLLYTPADGESGRPLLYPQFGMNQHVFGLNEFDFVTGINNTIAAGPLDGAQLDGQGRIVFDVFTADVAAARSEVVLDGIQAKADGFLRFAAIDSWTEPGTITLLVRVS